MFKSIMVAAMLAFSVTACSMSADMPVSTSTSIDMKTPQQTVFAIKSAYAGALTLAVAYNKRPRCGTPNAGTLCSDAAIIAQLRAADDTANNAINAAERAVRSLGASTDIVKAAIIAAQASVDAFKFVAIAAK